MAKKQVVAEEVKPAEVPVAAEEVKPAPLLRKFDVELPGCPVGCVIHEVTAEDCNLADDEACKEAVVKKYFAASGILKSIHQPVVFEVVK